MRIFATPAWESWAAAAMVRSDSPCADARRIASSRSRVASSNRRAAFAASSMGLATNEAVVVRDVLAGDRVNDAGSSVAEGEPEYGELLTEVPEGVVLGGVPLSAGDAVVVGDGVAVRLHGPTVNPVYGNVNLVSGRI